MKPIFRPLSLAPNLNCIIYFMHWLYFHDDIPALKVPYIYNRPERMWDFVHPVGMFS